MANLRQAANNFIYDYARGHRSMPECLYGKRDMLAQSDDCEVYVYLTQVMIPFSERLTSSALWPELEYRIAEHALEQKRVYALNDEKFRLAHDIFAEDQRALIDDMVAAVS